jgi:hypothetical protein
LVNRVYVKFENTLGIPQFKFKFKCIRDPQHQKIHNFPPILNGLFHDWALIQLNKTFVVCDRLETIMHIIFAIIRYYNTCLDFFPF